MHLYRCSNSRYVDYICILWYRYIPFSCSTIAVISGSCVRGTGKSFLWCSYIGLKHKRETPEKCMIFFFGIYDFFYFFAFRLNHIFYPFLIAPSVFSKVYFYLCLAFKGTMHLILRVFSWILFCFSLHIRKMSFVI